MTQNRVGKSRIKKLAILLTAVAFVCVYLYMFFSVNAKYPQNTKTVYGFGETFNHRGVDLKITKAEFFEGAELNKDNDFKDAMYISQDEDTTDEYKLIILDVDFYNTNDKAIRFDLTTLHVESNDFSMQFYYPLMLYYNGSGMYLELMPGEHKSLRLPLPIANTFFLDSAWKNVKNRDFYLVYSLYPVKNMAEIKFNV
jgi:hypothetical protein